MIGNQVMRSSKDSLRNWRDATDGGTEILAEVIDEKCVLPAEIESSSTPVSVLA